MKRSLAVQFIHHLLLHEVFEERDQNKKTQFPSQFAGFYQQCPPAFVLRQGCLPAAQRQQERRCGGVVVYYFSRRLCKNSR